VGVNPLPCFYTWEGIKMTIYRCILPDWAHLEHPELKKVIEGELTNEEVQSLNEQYYNIYYLPNTPSFYEGGTVSGSQIDQFNYVFVDMDLKNGVWNIKDSFIDEVHKFPLPPTSIVDSGNGIHVYWKMKDLDAKSYLKLQRRIIRYFRTDEAVGQIYQLMRFPNTVNTKVFGDFKLCQEIFHTKSEYLCGEMDKHLPILTFNDEEYANQHYNRTYNKEEIEEIDDTIPFKFAKLLESNPEVKDIWIGKSDDRSKDDFRLGHILFASGFTKAEATSVLVNTSKALQRAPKHRVSYATNIVDKIWIFEIAPEVEHVVLSRSVKDILSKNPEGNLKDKRFPCWKYLDNTERGFRLGQVIGLVAGSGVGKTAVALNMFEGFVSNNPDYDHFFVPLEQPATEIAERWALMCKGRPHMLEKVHVLDNYDDDGKFRHLSFTEIKDYLLRHQQLTGRKIGCVVIDHIGALKKKGRDGENQDLMDICHAMKGFAQETNTLLIMQSQAPRGKAGIGDVELDKDAAYGTMYFEAYCDYLITLWQPLKRCYVDGAPTVTSFKFCKIRHKKQGVDKILEDVPYSVLFDPHSGKLVPLNEQEKTSLDFFLKQASNKRKQDKGGDTVKYNSVQWSENGAINNSQDPKTATGSQELHKSQ
jgi:hypothetical protein